MYMTNKCRRTRKRTNNLRDELISGMNSASEPTQVNLPSYIAIHVGVSGVTGRLAQLVERRTREHNVSGLYRCGFESPAGQLKLLIVFRMRR